MERIKGSRVPFKLQVIGAVTQLMIGQYLFNSFWVNIYLITYWGCLWAVKYGGINRKYTAIFGTILLTTFYVHPVIAANNTQVKVCGVAFLNRIANLFSWMFAISGASNSADEVCQLFATIAAVAALAAIGTLAAGIFGARGGTPWQEAFMPFGWVLLLMVGSVVISNLFLGNYFPTSTANKGSDAFNLDPLIQQR